MPSKSVSIARALVFALAGASVVLPALADPPEGHDKHRRKSQGQAGQHDEGRGRGDGDWRTDERRPSRRDERDHGRDDRRGERREWRHEERVELRRDERREDRFARRHERHFADEHRVIVRDYYRRPSARGHCPPGLARKHNGCLPPGHARRWEYGRRLPREVIFYDVPPALVVQLGVPLPGHRYVRVGADILMIALGTAIVVDAIEDIGD